MGRGATPSARCRLYARQPQLNRQFSGHRSGDREIAFDSMRVFSHQRFLLYKGVHRLIARQQRGLSEFLAQMLNKYGVDRALVCQTHKIRQLLEIAPHDHDHQSEQWSVTSEPVLRSAHLMNIVKHTFELCALPYVFVALGRRSIQLDMQDTQSARDALLRTPMTH